MQEISRDDFQLLNGVVGPGSAIVNSGCESQQQRINSSSSPTLSTTIGKQQLHLAENVNGTFDASTLLSGSSIKLEDSNAIDLFPTHSQTWQQHPMNSHEHAHHRLQHHLHQHHRLDGKLLLQGSDDPMICRGANSVLNDDDHPVEFKTLIAAVSNGQRQQQQQQQQLLLQQQHQRTTTQPPLPPLHHPALAQQKRPQNSGCSTLTKQQLKVKAGLMSAQNQSQAAAAAVAAASTQVITAPNNSSANTNTSTTAAKQRIAPKPKKKAALKLRFHHQALPPEYLSHYEATQAAQQQKQQQQHVASKSATPLPTQAIKEPHVPKLTQTAKLPPPKSAHENVRSWLQKIAEIQRSAQQQQQQETPPQSTQPPLQPPSQQLLNTPQYDANNNHQLSRMVVSTTASSPTSMLFERVPVTESQTTEDVATQPPQKPLTSHIHAKRIVNYSDLPYMGEITLDNMKPRRGRKPKKADICHLIYKNYGTIFPGTPKNMFDPAHRNLLAATKLKPAQLIEAHVRGEEPLNLCLRDQSSEFYSISSGEEDDALATTTSEITSNCPTPVATPSDIATDTLLAANMKLSLPGLGEPLTAASVDGSSKLNKQEPQLAVEPGIPIALASNPITLNTLPHSMNVYLQQLLESGALIQHNGHAFGLPVETIQKDNQLTLKIPIPSGLFLTPKLEKASPALVPTPNIVALDYPEPMSTPSSIKSENSNSTMATTTTCSANAAATLQLPQQQHPQKRKRSAIFIPPMPAENTTNPATEVSICKFKFTGGAKPTLQEKKMLSVDSDGNYRYYSGTGDKSMRGYEFFPRESVQQSAGLLPGINCAAVGGAFINAAVDRHVLDIPPPSAGLSNELLQIPDSPTAGLLLNTTGGAAVVAPLTPSPQTPLAAQLYSNSPELQRVPSIQMNSSLMERQQQPFNDTPHAISIAKRTTAASTAPTCLKPTAVSAEERKKKSRRSSAREKLEKTFKEKGFLIQTQQLESAEGATYCKFRQLKKFTRYLFRNWKDYLPEELQQANAAAAAAAAAALAKQQNGEVGAGGGGGGGAVQQDASTAGHQAAIESILASHGFSSNSSGSGVGAQQRMLRDVHGSSVSMTTTVMENVS